ncbi:hypothetical protein BTVI_64908 [Pitangus sulphuratus]|nr:hypothetical protein BTVI_64908 [Pitangus sulphuratus]
MKKEPEFNLSGTEATSEVLMGRIYRITQLILWAKEKAVARGGEGKKLTSKGQVLKVVGLKELLRSFFESYNERQGLDLKLICNASETTGVLKCVDYSLGINHLVLPMAPSIHGKDIFPLKLSYKDSYTLQSIELSIFTVENARAVGFIFAVSRGENFTLIFNLPWILDQELEKFAVLCECLVRVYMVLCGLASEACITFQKVDKGIIETSLDSMLKAQESKPGPSLAAAWFAERITESNRLEKTSNIIESNLRLNITALNYLWQLIQLNG